MASDEWKRFPFKDGAGKMTPQWTQDCNGKEDYDADPVSLDVRYYPPWKDPAGKPSVLASVYLGGEKLIDAELLGESEAEVKALAEKWAADQYARIRRVMVVEFLGSDRG